MIPGPAGVSSPPSDAFRRYWQFRGPPGGSRRPRFAVVVRDMLLLAAAGFLERQPPSAPLPRAGHAGPALWSVAAVGGAEVNRRGACCLLGSDRPCLSFVRSAVCSLPLNRAEYNGCAAGGNGIPLAFVDRFPAASFPMFFFAVRRASAHAGHRLLVGVGPVSSQELVLFGNSLPGYLLPL